MAVKLGKGKVEGINACANKAGVIAAAAMDQRGSLEKSIAKARGGPATPEDLVSFKNAVSSVLTKHASAILLDPEFGLPAVKVRAKGTGVLLAYEKTGYDTKDDSRMPDLLPEWSVRRGQCHQDPPVLQSHAPGEGKRHQARLHRAGGR